MELDITNSISLHRFAVLRRTYDSHPDLLQQCKQIDRGSLQHDPTGRNNRSITPQILTSHELSESTQPQKQSSSLFTSSSGPSIFEDPEPNMDESAMDAQTSSTTSSATVEVPHFILFEDGDKLRLCETAIKRYVECYNTLRELQPVLADLYRYLRYPSQTLSDLAGKTFRPAALKINDISCDLSSMPPSSALEGLLQVIQAALKGQHTATITMAGMHADGSHGDRSPAAADEFKKDDDESRPSRQDSPMAEMDDAKAQMEAPGHVDPSPYEFLHLATSEEPLQSLTPLFGIINHEYGVLMNGPIRKAEKLIAQLQVILHHSPAKVAAELQRIQFRAKYDEWETEFVNVWYRLGGNKTW